MAPAGSRCHDCTIWRNERCSSFPEARQYAKERAGILDRLECPFPRTECGRAYVAQAETKHTANYIGALDRAALGCCRNAMYLQEIVDGKKTSDRRAEPCARSTLPLCSWMPRLPPDHITVPQGCQTSPEAVRSREKGALSLLESECSVVSSLRVNAVRVAAGTTRAAYRLQSSLPSANFICVAAEKPAAV